MKGLELSKQYFEEYGKPMLENDYKELMPFLATGFVGSGSERFGFDDEISQDHDFEPGFCIFIPDESVLDSRSAFRLERAYAKLPKEFMGFRRQMMSPVGGNRNGVILISDFYSNTIGANYDKLSLSDWLRIPDYSLAEATNGVVFFDEYGEFSRIREMLLDMPRDAKLKRIAGNLLIMSQAGQYNYPRCIKRGETEAAQLACYEFVNAAMKVYFLLNGKYMPYYKWSFRALRNIDGSEHIAEKLSYIINSGIKDSESAEDKYYAIEDVASQIIDILQDNDITKAICGDLEKHAYSVNDMIEDGSVRNMHILAAV